MMVVNTAAAVSIAVFVRTLVSIHPFHFKDLQSCLFSCMLDNFACVFVVCGFVFKLTFFNLPGITSGCQTV